MIKTMIKTKQIPKYLEVYLINFFKILFRKGKQEMDWLNLSPQEEQEIISSFEDLILEKMSIEKRLKGLAPEDRLKGLDPEDFFKRFDPEVRLKGLDPKDRLKGLDIEVIETYLNSLKFKRGR